MGRFLHKHKLAFSFLLYLLMLYTLWNSCPRQEGLRCFAGCKDLGAFLLSHGSLWNERQVLRLEVDGVSQ